MKFVDLPLDRDRRRTFVAEVKWGSRPVARSTIDDLRSRAARAPELRDVDITFALISRSGFTGRRKQLDDERFIRPGDMMVGG